MRLRKLVNSSCPPGLRRTSSRDEFSRTFPNDKPRIVEAVMLFTEFLRNGSGSPSSPALAHKALHNGHNLMNECMKKKLSTQTSKEEGNRSLLSKPPRRIYNTPLRVQRRRRSLLSPQIGNNIKNHDIEVSTHSFPLLTIHIHVFTSSK